MRKTMLTLCAALMAVPLGFAAPAVAQSVQFSIGPGGPQVGFYTRGPNAWYNGHRGYHNRRDGWRYYRGYWFPPQAFVVTRPAPRHHYRQHRVSNAHVEWCYDRYRSYRASDNTYQPYHGPRRQCYSPYS